jgi:outer membrane protein assembly factor BamD
VRDYPLSLHVGDAKDRLQALNAPVPPADPVATARMQYELENRTKRAFVSKVWGGFSGRPDTSAAARSGKPQMQGMRPSIPANVPPVAAGMLGTSGDITVSVPGDASALDNNPDARSAPPGQAAAGTEASAQTGAQTAPASQAPAKSPAKAQKKAKPAKPPKPPKPPKKGQPQVAPAAATPAPAPAAGGDTPPKP